MHKCECGKVGHIYVGRDNRYHCGECFSKYKVLKGIKAEIDIIKRST